MNGPARCQDITKLADKERQKQQVPDVKNAKKDIHKIIEPVGAMDAGLVPEGTIEK
jgi:hypothetical protein